MLTLAYSHYAFVSLKDPLQRESLRNMKKESLARDKKCGMHLKLSEAA